ncbi:MAG: NUDIX domain-containing protein [Rhodothermales bacterium]|nr:NUDIX domain-containing protein [Rhodothermales bacterium]
MRHVAFQESAGGVIVDRGRVLLIQARTRAGTAVWTLPKGRIRRGEPLWEAALREVREETGYLCRLRRRLKNTSYVFRSGAVQIRKTVHWFLLEPVHQAGVPDPAEVEAIRWFAFDEALRRLAYRSDRGLLTAARDALEQNGDG